MESLKGLKFLIGILPRELVSTAWDGCVWVGI